MSDSGSELERWLSCGEFLASDSESTDTWEPGFEVDRQVVRSRLGGVYQKLFLRPDVFSKRFYHEIFPLAIEEWSYQEQIEMYDGFCLVDVEIELRFQATLDYVQRNAEALPDVNSHIKRSFRNMLTDIVHEKVRGLDDGRWVEVGLLEFEKGIAKSICEQFMMQNIQSRALCKMGASFQEFPNIRPGRDNVYLHVLKQSHELAESKNQAFFKRHQAIKDQKLLHKQQELEQLQKFTDLERQKRAQKATARLTFLEDEERQLKVRLAIEKRMHNEKISHQNELKELEAKAELQTGQKIRALERTMESHELGEKLIHQKQLEEQKIQADIARREKQQILQTRIQDNKTRAEVERYEKQQETWRDAKLRIHEQQLVLKKRQKELELEAEQEFVQSERDTPKNPIVMPFQKLEKNDDPEKIKRRSEALRNEIELSLLEKQRLDLEMAITEAQKNRLTEED